MSNLTTNLRCNEQIRLPQVRLIGANNEQIGVIATLEAMRMARDAGLDLVEVAPRERPPVCRLMDYGKYKYHQKKNLKKHHEQQIKEVRMRPKTDQHDRSIKVRNALRFLSKGDKVQFTMQFRGRERAHREIGTASFQRILEEIQEFVKVDRPPSMDGRNLIMVVAPVKAAIDKAVAEGRLAFLARAHEAEKEPNEPESAAPASAPRAEAGGS